ncbi:MAG TPA: type II toxin-antitoxin system HicB family antitoxin [Methanoculleus sp.]|jgi:predicted RNase H-like HicB family nuclease|nr:type II toxin-antitoxin system HicB family antitoxin [Methanoculleus sp.]
MIVEFKTYFCDGWWGAHATEHSIYTQGRTVGDLIDNILEATELHLKEELERGEPITIITAPEPLTVATPDLPVIRFEYRADLARRL